MDPRTGDDQAVGHECPRAVPVRNFPMMNGRWSRLKASGKREHELREVFNGRRDVIRTGASWRWMPNDRPPSGLARSPRGMSAQPTGPAVNCRPDAQWWQGASRRWPRTCARRCTWLRAASPAPPSCTAGRTAPRPRAARAGMTALVDEGHRAAPGGQHAGSSAGAARDRHHRGQGARHCTGHGAAIRCQARLRAAAHAPAPVS